MVQLDFAVDMITSHKFGISPLPPTPSAFRSFLRLVGILSRHVAIFGEVLGIFLVYDIHDLCYFHIIAELLLVAKQSWFVFLLFFPSLVSIYEVYLSVC